MHPQQSSHPDSPRILGAREGPPDSLSPIPYYRDLQAGAGRETIPVEEEEQEILWIDQAWMRRVLNLIPAHARLITVTGDSMTPTLNPGDIALFDDRDTTGQRDGAIYVIRFGDGLMIKRLQRLSPSRLQFISDNKRYHPTKLSLKEVGEDIAILGRVVWVGRLM